MYLSVYLSMSIYMATLSPLSAAAPIHASAKAPADPIKQPQRPAQANKMRATAGAKKGCEK